MPPTIYSGRASSQGGREELVRENSRKYSKDGMDLLSSVAYGRSDLASG